MAHNYREYLAANVLNEGNSVTYRLLSRAVKVQSNVAKQMLYEFHRTQNARKANSVHATYLVTGTPKVPWITEEGESSSQAKQPNGVSHPSQDAEGDSLMQDNDSFMLSSSLPGSSQPDGSQAKGAGKTAVSDEVKVTSMLLVQEGDLESVKDTFEQPPSMHIYSLSPGRLNNIQILSDCNRRVRAEFGHEDPLEKWQTYGTIHNPRAQRRPTHRPPAPPQPQPPSTSAMKPTQTTSSTAAPPRPADSRASVNRPTSGSGKPNAKPAPPRRSSSNLFQSFAKSRPPDPGQNSAAAEGRGRSDSNASSTSDSRDEAMPDAPERQEEAEEDEEEGTTDPEDALYALDSRRKGKPPPAHSPKTKEQSQDNAETDANLKRMMDDPSPSPPPPAKQETPENIKNDDDDDEEKDGEAPDSPARNKLAPSDAPPKKRRVRRQVMKKKTYKDAEGYLVTKQEPVWESAEEDVVEAQEAKRPKVESVAKKGSASASGGARGEGKRGQGNIMKFFGRK